MCVCVCVLVRVTNHLYISVWSHTCKSAYSIISSEYSHFYTFQEVYQKCEFVHHMLFFRCYHALSAEMHVGSNLVFKGILTLYFLVYFLNID